MVGWWARGHLPVGCLGLWWWVGRVELYLWAALLLLPLFLGRRFDFVRTVGRFLWWWQVFGLRATVHFLGIRL